MYLLDLRLKASLVLAAAVLCAQEQKISPAGPSIDSQNSVVQPGSRLSSYTLGPDDQITVHVSHVEELALGPSRPPTRLDTNGEINLPLIGTVHAAGLTVRELEAEIRSRLERFVRSPDVVVEITDFRSEPVSLLGALNNPGVHQLEGHKSLFEALSLAGGPRSDAGNTVTITRNLEWGPIPLPNATTDPTGKFSIASIDVRRINASDPSVNIPIKPNDAISVSEADIVYAIGCVRKPGGFTLGQKSSLSALQVIALADGLDRFADARNAKIIRPVAGTSNHVEIPIDLKKLMATGQGTNPVLRSEDILFVPVSSKKAAMSLATEGIVRVASGVAVYGVHY